MRWAESELVMRQYLNSEYKLWADFPMQIEEVGTISRLKRLELSAETGVYKLARVVRISIMNKFVSHFEELL
jgi:hypothetical protein